MFASALMVHVNGPLKQLNFGTGKTKQGIPTQSNDINSSLSLFGHMYVCIDQKYSVSKALFSLLICM